MKEGLRKLKGTCISTEMGEVNLCDTYREDDCQYDQLYYTTQHDSITVKLYDIEKEQSAERFRHEQQFFIYYRQAYLRQVYEQMPDILCIKQIQVKKESYGLIMLKITKGTTLKQISSTFSYGEWLSFVQIAISFIDKLKNQKQAFLNFHPSNVARNSFGELRITDPQYLTDEGTYQQVEAKQAEYLQKCEKQYRYKAPELLDQYIKGRIDYKTDLFAFATVLYQQLYHQYPFESKLAQISCNCRPFPEESFFTSLISKLLKPYHQRESLQNIKVMIQAERTKTPKEQNAKQMSSGSTNQSKGGNIFSGITQMFSKLTTETQSWYLNFTENDNSRPDEKYLNQMVSKLYKKEGKLEKLQSVILKYIQQGSFVNDQFRFTKTAILMLQLIRRGPNATHYEWDDILQNIESKCSGSQITMELCQFFRQKMALHGRYKGVFRGNFYLEDFSKFKCLTTEFILFIQDYLTWLINSLKNKLLFMKKDENLTEYLKQVYCDEILDVISTMIFTILSIHKDNELKLRKDTLSQLKETEKKINGFLQKISYLSNHVSGHGIYSLEADYMYYQEQIQVKDNPYYTTLQHFYKYCRQYKGLCVPQNYSLTYSTGDHKQFLSGQNNRNERKFTQKSFFAQDDEEDNHETSFKIIEAPPSPQKIKLQQKFLQQLKEKPKPKIKQESKSVIQAPKLFQVKQHSQKIQKKDDPKKTVSFDQFFNFDAKPASNVSIPVPQKKDELFDFSNKAEKIGSPTYPEKKVQGFAFFDAFFTKQPEKTKQKQEQKVKSPQSFNDFFENFQKFKQGDLKKQKSALSGSSSQKIIHDISQFQGMKKPMDGSFKSSPQKARPKIDSELLQNILSGLKLKELKDIIVENQDVIINFEKLKLDKVIGSGSAGEVYLGKHNNETLAIKKVKTKQNPNALKQFQRQLLTYIKIKRNPFLVSLVGLSKSSQDYFLLTQFCNAGSLFDLLHKKANSIALSWKQRIQMAIEIAKGMLALHEMKPPIIHRDLKSLNVFVSESNGKFTSKVADFGLSRSPESEMMTMYLGTLHWMAPQLLDNRQYSIKVDIYSFAVVLWQICARKTPYNELSSPMAIIKHVTMEQKRPNLTLIPAECPRELIDLMKNCWSHEPNSRPDFSQIIDRLSKIKPVF